MLFFRERHGEGRAFARLTLNAHVRLLDERGVLHDGEAQPRAAGERRVRAHLAPEKTARDRHALRRGPRRGRRGGGASLKDLLTHMAP